VGHAHLVNIRKSQGNPEPRPQRILYCSVDFMAYIAGWFFNQWEYFIHAIAAFFITSIFWAQLLVLGCLTIFSLLVESRLNG
jgi:hypothetical protein